MKAKINKWGNNLAIRFPAKLSKALALENGQELEIELKDGGLFLSIPQAKRKINMKTILEGLTEETQHDDLIPDVLENEEW